MRTAVRTDPPPLEALGKAIGGWLDADGVGELRLTRHPNAHASTFPSEFLTLSIPGHPDRELFAKYGPLSDQPSFGHRRGLLYEGEVLEWLQGVRAAGVPGLCGLHQDPERGQVWLVQERIHPAVRLTECADPAVGMVAAARWLARFHSQSPAGAPPSGWIRHDRAYYAGWIHRTAEFAHALAGDHPWIRRVERAADDLMAPLLEAPLTVVHGELYPHNVLVRNQDVVVVDWQSAAWAPAELDLAALTERWPDNVRIGCEREYIRSVGESVCGPGLDERLAAARIHWLFRWMGDRTEWTLAERSHWRLKALGEALLEGGHV